MNNESFDKIAEVFNTSFIETSAIDNEIQILEDKKNELTSKIVNKNEITLKDQEYLEEQLKYLIQKNKDVLDKISTDIKVGSSPRMFEVYAKISDAIINSLKELKDLNKLISDMLLMKNGFDPFPKENDKISMTASQIMEMINNAKENSELKQISTDFKIINNEEK